MVELNVKSGSRKVDAKYAHIDGVAHAIEKGETILSFIKRHKGQKEVPTLCDAPNLEPFGSCRVCSVEVALEENGKTKTQAACHTPIAEGHYIYPNSKAIKELRKNIIELVLTNSPCTSSHARTQR